jgi:hypothetical protein
MLSAKILQTSGICKTNHHVLPFHLSSCGEYAATATFHFLIPQSSNINAVVFLYQHIIKQKIPPSDGVFYIVCA